MAALPEEVVRQKLVRLMIDKLGFPFYSFVVEKSLSHFPHLLEKRPLPDCRVDIACVVKGIHPDHQLFPLVAIECKAVPLTSSTLEQIVGYNYYLEAPFIAVANQNEIKTGWFDEGKGGYEFMPGLPAYQDLLVSIPLNSV